MRRQQVYLCVGRRVCDRRWRSVSARRLQYPVSYSKNLTVSVAVMRYMKGDSPSRNGSDVQAVHNSGTGRQPCSSAAPQPAGTIMSKARELNRISQTKYRQRLKVCCCIMRILRRCLRQLSSNGIAGAVVQ